jgi:hypothetical protein
VGDGDAVAIDVVEHFAHVAILAADKRGRACPRERGI